MAVRDVGGRIYVDARVWSRSGATFFPTSAGVEIPLRLLSSLAEASAEALRDAIADGVIAPPVRARRRG